MGFFSDNYLQLQFVYETGEHAGLRKAQIGAIHSIAAHATTSKKPGIVIMPTGTGKTAVMMMAPFVLRSNRMLIITPSKLVRNQIAGNFRRFEPLRSLGVLNISTTNLQVKEVDATLTTAAEWSALSNCQVVVSTPRCISPGLPDIFVSDPGFFDLVVIDEAHHSPAKSWKSIIEHYANAVILLFTATPFRRDNQEIGGKVIYNYPISLAYEEGIFGETQFIPVEAQAGDDAAIARKCEAVFQQEQDEIVHYVMVRTDSKKRARELFELYQSQTSLRLKLIHSDLSPRKVNETIIQLRAGQLDGIVCVDMLGEGFDLPNLKIAAIHSPHKSLAATLQFIGRFTRTNANNISYAKFIAIPAEIEIEKRYLYRSNAIWKQLIIDLSETRIDSEISYRELIDGFTVNEEQTTEEYREISLSGIEPFFHVKIYSLQQGLFVPEQLIDLTEFDMEIVHREDDAGENVSILILRQKIQPRWYGTPAIMDIAHELVIVYFDAESSLLFINSTLKKSIEFYEFIFSSYCPDSSGQMLSDRELNSVLANIDQAEFFNIGLRNRSHYGTNESYRIIAGQTAHLSIDRRDAHTFHRGHLMGKGKEGGANVSIGLSSSSKVWSNRSGNLQEFLVWARLLALKIRQRLEGRTNTPIDNLPTSLIIDVLPDKDPIVVNWHETAFMGFINVQFVRTNGSINVPLTEIDLELSIADSDHEHYRVTLRCTDFELPVFFSFNYDHYFTSENPILSDRLTVFRNDRDSGMSIMDYLNNYPLSFYYPDFSYVYNNYFYLEGYTDIVHFDPRYINDAYDWSGSGIDIENECDGDNSIHAYFRRHFASQQLPFCYYDHGTGEVADFITAEMVREEILVSLYHCKGSGAAQTGNRVDDWYEVMGQGIKSLSYTTYLRLKEKLKLRQRNKTIGDTAWNMPVDVLENLVSAHRGIAIAFRIVLVQPGLSKQNIAEKISQLLSAANMTIRNTNNCRHLEVICSS